MGDATIAVAGEVLRLLPERGVYWEAERSLFIADLHLGKAASFREAAVPIPTGTTSVDLDRLHRAVTRTGARRLYVLGDMYHHETGLVSEIVDAWSDWLVHHDETHVHIVIGNHDRHVGRPPVARPLCYHDQPVDVGPFRLNHFPEIEPGVYSLAGHLHPGIVLEGPGRDRVRAPCFHIRQTHAVLPAFGSFTGLSPVHRTAGDRVFAVADNDVVRVF